MLKYDIRTGAKKIKTKIDVTKSLMGLVALALPAVVFLSSGGALAASSVVSPTSPNGWNFFTEVPNGSGGYENGPENPPMGTGSAYLTVNDTGRQILYTPNHAGVLLEDITSLQYSTYGVASGNPTVYAASLQFDVDYDMNDAITAWQGRLVYEPYMNGSVALGEWQTWNPLQGIWWASGVPGNTVCPQNDPCTWSEVLGAFPDAGIRANIGNVNFKAGGPWLGGYDGNVDAFTIGVNGQNTTYNFELVNPPANKDACKKGGWVNLTDQNGDSFKNQGQCVSWTNGRGQ